MHLQNVIFAGDSNLSMQAVARNGTRNQLAL